MTRKKLLVVGWAVALLTFSFSSHAATVVGTGNDISSVVIEAAAFGAPLIFEYHYTFDTGNPFDGYALFNFIDSAVVELSFTWVNFGGGLDGDGDPIPDNFFLDSITYNSTTLTNTAWPDVGPYWAQWVAGGESGYPTASPIAMDVWNFGSGFSSPYRVIQPGSWDGVIFNDGDIPPVEPIPEPSALLLFGAASAWMLRRFRRK